MTIYYADINGLNETLFNEGVEKLGDYRRNKINSLKQYQDKCRSLLAGLLLNYSVKHFKEDKMDCELEEVTPDCLVKEFDEKYEYEIGVLPNKKPYFVGRNLHFNLTHSGTYAACVVCGRPVGLDIEGERKVNFKVSKRFFTENESNFIGEDTDRFFRVWTLKEAYGKAIGDGIAQTIQKTEFRFGKDDTPELFIDGVKQECTIFENSIKNYKIALVIAGLN